MIEIVGPFNSGAAAGSAGSALSDQDSPVHVAGLVEAVYVQYNPAYPDNPPATTDITISTKGANGAAPSLALLSLANGNTDGWFFPRAAIHDQDGAAIAAEYDKLPVYDLVNVAIAGADEGNHVDVWLMVQR